MSELMGVRLDDQPAVTRYGLLSTQVCVPEGWTDEQVKAFADRENPAGTAQGWFIRKEGDETLAGMPERNPCGGRAGFVHIMLDC